MTASLVERLRNETRALHTEVERGSLMRALLRGELGQVPYGMLLRNLHAIYTALEAALIRHAPHPLVAPVFATALFRSDALARDLNALFGASWKDSIAMQPDGQQYVDRLRELDQSDPGLLVAHAYVRYLGDLSGGQLLKRIVSKSFGLAAGEGIAFYDFGDSDRTRALTLALRAGLERIDADDSRISAIVAEARQAFERHRSLFQQIAGACGMAGVARPLDTVKAP